MSDIELSTIVFYEGRLPGSLLLHECSVPLIKPVPGALAAIYGTSSKPDAFATASRYAKNNGFEYTVIDITVELEKRPNPTVMKIHDLANYDFLSMLRMGISMRAPIFQWIRAGLLPGDERIQLLDKKFPTFALAHDPSLFAVLMESSACSHLKLVACPAVTKIDNEVFNVGVIPFRHWSAIKKATCRYDPRINIDLTLPSSMTQNVAMPGIGAL